MAYERRIDRANPGCILFLVDQSGSMARERRTAPRHRRWSPSPTRSTTSSPSSCSPARRGDEGVRHYFDIGLIGYGEHVGPALGGALANRDLVSIVELANNPLTATPAHSG